MPEPRKGITDAGVDRIKDWEEYRDYGYYANDVERLEGKVTGGHGVTGKYKYGEYIEPERGRADFKEALRDAENTVNKYVTFDINEHQRNALVSLVFNAGVGNFRSSKALKHLNKGELEEFKYEAFDPIVGFVRFVKGGEPKLGLQRRRARESRMWDGDYEKDEWE